VTQNYGANAIFAKPAGSPASIDEMSIGWRPFLIPSFSQEVPNKRYTAAMLRIFPQL
jgi:hypothetical protein